MEFNAVLDRESRPENLNEGFLARQLETLDGLDVGRGGAYWLTLARITELTLLCAGTYADNGELAAAGDLLVNPRLTVIHVRGVSEPLVKNRRESVAAQLCRRVPTAEGTVDWLKGNTWVEIRKEPLLPHLYRRLVQSGLFYKAYLESVDWRMKRVADVMISLSSWDLPDRYRLHEHLDYLTPPEHGFARVNLCGFEQRPFHELGEEIRGINHHGVWRSRFLLDPTVQSRVKPLQEAGGYTFPPGRKRPPSRKAGRSSEYSSAPTSSTSSGRPMIPPGSPRRRLRRRPTRE